MNPLVSLLFFLSAAWLVSAEVREFTDQWESEVRGGEVSERKTSEPVNIIYLDPKTIASLLKTTTTTTTKSLPKKTAPSGEKVKSRNFERDLGESNNDEPLGKQRNVIPEDEPQQIPVKQPTTLTTNNPNALPKKTVFTTKSLKTTTTNTDSKLNNAKQPIGTQQNTKLGNQPQSITPKQPTTVNPNNLNVLPKKTVFTTKSLKTTTTNNDSTLLNAKQPVGTQINSKLGNQPQSITPKQPTTVNSNNLNVLPKKTGVTTKSLKTTTTNTDSKLTNAKQPVGTQQNSNLGNQPKSIIPKQPTTVNPDNLNVLPKKTVFTTKTLKTTTSNTDSKITNAKQPVGTQQNSILGNQPKSTLANPSTTVNTNNDNVLPKKASFTPKSLNTANTGSKFSNTKQPETFQQNTKLGYQTKPVNSQTNVGTGNPTKRGVSVDSKLRTGSNADVSVNTKVKVTKDQRGKDSTSTDLSLQQQVKTDPNGRVTLKQKLNATSGSDFSVNQRTQAGSQPDLSVNQQVNSTNSDLSVKQQTKAGPKANFSSNQQANIGSKPDLSVKQQVKTSEDSDLGVKSQVKAGSKGNISVKEQVEENEDGSQADLSVKQKLNNQPTNGSKPGSQFTLNQKVNQGSKTTNTNTGSTLNNGRQPVNGQQNTRLTNTPNPQPTVIKRNIINGTQQPNVNALNQGKPTNTNNDFNNGKQSVKGQPLQPTKQPIVTKRNNLNGPQKSSTTNNESTLNNSNQIVKGQPNDKLKVPQKSEVVNGTPRNTLPTKGLFTKNGVRPPVKKRFDNQENTVPAKEPETSL